MSGHLAQTIALYALGLAGLAAVLALVGRPRGRYLIAGVVGLELASILQAALDVAGLLNGHRPAERATHLGYVAASVLVLPIVLSASGPESEATRWDSLIAAIGCLACATVALRLRATWAPGGA